MASKKGKETKLVIEAVNQLDRQSASSVSVSQSVSQICTLDKQQGFVVKMQCHETRYVFHSGILSAVHAHV